MAASLAGGLRDDIQRVVGVPAHELSGKRLPRLADEVGGGDVQLAEEPALFEHFGDHGAVRLERPEVEPLDEVVSEPGRIGRLHERHPGHLADFFSEEIRTAPPERAVDLAHVPHRVRLPRALEGRHGDDVGHEVGRRGLVLMCPESL